MLAMVTREAGGSRLSKSPNLPPLGTDSPKNDVNATMADAEHQKKIKLHHKALTKKSKNSNIVLPKKQ